MEMRRRLQFALLLLLALVVTGAASAEMPRALGGDGTIFSLAQGTYGELFPAGSEDAADHPILALEIRRPQSEPELVAVPATFGPSEELSPMLVMESSSNTVFLLWESWSGLTQSRFLISSFQDSAWSEVIEITGTPFSYKSAASIAVTHDVFDCLLGTCVGEATSVSRTVVHLIWQQDSERGTPVTIYAPLVLENGHYIDEHPQIVLNDLLPVPEGESTTLAARVAPQIRTGRSNNGVVIGFLDGETGQLASVEVRVLPGELSDLGDVLRDGVQEAGEGKDLGDDGDLQAIIDQARHQLIDVGARLDPEVLSRLVDATEVYLGNAKAEEAVLEHVATGARHQLIDVGARLTERRLMRTVGEARHQLIDVGVRGRGDVGKPTQHRHDLQVQTVHAIAAPDLPTATWKLFLAPSGKHPLVAWNGENVVRYRESTDAGWSETFDLKLNERLDQSDAERILEQRVQGR